MDKRDIFLFLLLLGLVGAKVQLKNTGQGRIPYQLCTNNDTPKEECATDGIFSMDHCVSGSLQIDAAEGEVRLVVEGETWYATNDSDAHYLMKYVSRIFCDKPVEPLLIKTITYDKGANVWIQMDNRWRLGAWNYTEENIDRDTKNIMVQCIRLEEISVNVPEGYDINKYDNNNITALVWAIGFGDLESVQSMVANGADLNKVYLNLNLTAMHMAASTCNEEVAKFLITKGVAVDVVSYGDKTPLHVACYSDALKTARLLLNTFSGNVNTKDELGRTALQYAAMSDSPEMIDLLISSGADVMAKDKNGFTALHFGASVVEGSVIEKLVTSGIPVDVPNNDGATPLMLAVMSGWPKPIEALIKLKANIKATDKEGHTVHSYVKTLSQQKRAAVEKILKAHGVPTEEN